MKTSNAPEVTAIFQDDVIAKLIDGFIGRDWIFKEIDNWLTNQDERFFILTGEPGIGKSALAAQLTQIRQDIAAYHFCIAGRSGTIEPNNVLLSLAAQLVEYFPDYAETLANIIKPLKLSVNVDITIQNIKDSTVRGVVIKNLHTQNPQEALNIILRQALAALPNPPKQPRLILIDSLDEAVTFSDRDNLITLLAGLNDLPPWVRVLLTSRPEDRVLVEFEPLEPYRIEEMSRQNLSDVRAYVEGRVEQCKLQEKLTKAALVPQTLIDEVTKLSDGNFLYAKLLLNDIEAGRQSLDDLSALPKSIDEIYLAFLRRFKPEEWRKQYQPILGTLTVTQEPVTEDELANFTEIKPRILRQDLGIIRQFLDVIENDEGDTAYAIFHQSLRDYLLNKKRNKYFWCDAQEQHDLIIDYYHDGNKSWDKVVLEKIDRYGRRHLAQHLVKGERVEELHTLLSLEKDGKNAWFKVKDDEGDTAGFLADVELAWSQSDEAYEREPAKSIGLQCRYALIKTSINSLAGLPKELIVALVKHQYWKPVKALAYVRQIPDPKQRFESLIALANQLPDAEPLKYQVLQSALQTTEQIQDSSARASALTALSDKVPDVLPLALKTAQSIHDDSSRASALTVLGGKMPDALPLALETAQAIQNDFSRVSALEELFPKLTLDLLHKALQVVQATQNEYCRALVLSALVPKLTSDLFSIALEIAQALQDKFSRTKVLIILGDKLPSVLPQALEIAQLIQDEESRAQALIAMVPKLTPDLLFKALDIAQVIQSEFWRASVLIVLSDKMPHLLPEALEAAQAIQGNYSRACALTALADKLPDILSLALEAAQLSIQEGELVFYRPVIDLIVRLVAKLPDTLLPLALETVQVIQEDYFRADVLMALVPNLTDTVLPHVLKLAQEIEKISRIQLVTVLGNKWPDVLPLALETAQTIQDEFYRAQAIAALGDKDTLLLALKTTLTIQNEYSRDKALAGIIFKLTPDLLPKSLEIVQHIKYEDTRSRALATIIVPQLIPELLPRALEITRAITNKHYRTNVLITIVDKLPEAFSEALESALMLQDKERTKALIALIPKLPPALLSQKLPQILESIQAIQKEEYRAKALRVLIPKVPETLLPQLFEASQRIRNDYFRAQVLTVLGDKIPEVLPLVLPIIQNIGSEYFRAHILTMLGNKLPHELLPQALANIYKIQDEGYRAWCLEALVPNLPDEFLPQVLESVQTIQSEYHRTQLLIVLSEKLPEALPQALVAAQAIQSDSSRAQLLIVLSEKLPEALPQALVAAQAIQSDSSRAQLLIALSEKLPEALPQALVAAQAIQKEKYRAQALTELVLLMPEALPQALAAAQAIQEIAIQGEEDRAPALTALASHLINDSNCFSLWKGSLHFLSHRTRSNLLIDMTSLTPVIFSLCSDEPIELIQGIQDVARWWP